MRSINEFGAHGHSGGDAGLIDPVLESHTRLLASEDIAQEITDALATVGRASGVDRVYLFEISEGPDGSLSASQRYEWVREGVRPEIDNPDLQNVPLEAAGYGRWARLLADYQPVFGVVEEFPAEEQPLLAAQSILSLLVLPVFSDGSLWGFVGFDDCRRRKAWTRGDVDLLLSLSISIGARVARDRGRRGVDAHAAEFVGVVKSLMKLKDVAGSRQPLEEILEQLRARIRALVGIHRYLVTTGDGPTVDADDLLTFWETELRRSVDGCGPGDVRVRAMAESFALPRALVLKLALLVHELVLAYVCTFEAGGAGGLSVGVHEEHGTAVIRVHLETDGGNPPVGATPDPLGLVLVRRIAQALSGYLLAPAGAATAQLVIPLHDPG
jgi:two-component sensor histidine kinase